MVQPDLGAGGSSALGGYELGFGAETWVYENERFEEDASLLCATKLDVDALGTGRGADFLGAVSSSDPESQASSSPQSNAEKCVECTPMCGRAGGERAIGRRMPVEARSMLISLTSFELCRILA